MFACHMCSEALQLTCERFCFHTSLFYLSSSFVHVLCGGLFFEIVFSNLHVFIFCDFFWQFMEHTQIHTPNVVILAGNFVFSCVDAPILGAI